MLNLRSWLATADGIFDTDTMRLASLGPILAANDSSALKSIYLHSNVGFRNNPVLWGLDCALQDLAGKNVLEELELCIKVNIEDDIDCTDSGDLENLDRVLTEQGAFPKLRRVSIEFKWHYYMEDEADDPEYIVTNVTREDFPRLCSNQAFDFSFRESDFIDQ